MFSSTNILIYLNSVSLFLAGVPAALMPVAAWLPASFSIYLFVATSLVNVAILAHKKSVENADASALAAASEYVTVVKL